MKSAVFLDRYGTIIKDRAILVISVRLNFMILLSIVCAGCRKNFCCSL